jgi:hypothetical protein
MAVQIKRTENSLQACFGDLRWVAEPRLVVQYDQFHQNNTSSSTTFTRQSHSMGKESSDEITRRSTFDNVTKMLVCKLCTLKNLSGVNYAYFATTVLSIVFSIDIVSEPHNT